MKHKHWHDSLTTSHASLGGSVCAAYVSATTIFVKVTCNDMRVNYALHGTCQVSSYSNLNFCLPCRHLASITDCLDEYVRKQWNRDVMLADIPHLVRPKRQSLAVTAFKVMHMQVSCIAMPLMCRHLSYDHAVPFKCKRL